MASVASVSHSLLEILKRRGTWRSLNLGSIRQMNAQKPTKISWFTLCQCHKPTKLTDFLPNHDFPFQPTTKTLCNYVIFAIKYETRPSSHAHVLLDGVHSYILKGATRPRAWKITTARSSSWVAFISRIIWNYLMENICDFIIYAAIKMKV